jgi:uncharacterized protein (TIGR02757 family)
MEVHDSQDSYHNSLFLPLKTEVMRIKKSDLKEFLDEKVELYNRPSFIESDPISIPHRYPRKEDIEISGFLTASIAWGRRDLILRSSNKLVSAMGNSPHEFILDAGEKELDNFSGFVHRTFNGRDCKTFIRGLKNIYTSYNSIEDVIVEGMNGNGSLIEGLSHFRNTFFIIPHERRSEKHFADVLSGAAGKRLFMFLRWMVRDDRRGVDFGIWKRIRPSELYIPLDLHSGNTARKLGLLKRKQNDFKAVDELTSILRQFDPDDPVKYDFALFGLGVNEEF